MGLQHKGNKARRDRNKMHKSCISKLHLQIKELLGKEPQLEGKIMAVKPFLQSLGISDQN